MKDRSIISEFIFYTSKKYEAEIRGSNSSGILFPSFCTISHHPSFPSISSNAPSGGTRRHKNLPILIAIRHETPWHEILWRKGWGAISFSNKFYFNNMAVFFCKSGSLCCLRVPNFFLGPGAIYQPSPPATFLPSDGILTPPHFPNFTDRSLLGILRTPIDGLLKHQIITSRVYRHHQFYWISHFTIKIPCSIKFALQSPPSSEFFKLYYLLFSVSFPHHKYFPKQRSFLLIRRTDERYRQALPVLLSTAARDQTTAQPWSGQKWAKVIGAGSFGVFVVFLQQYFFTAVEIQKRLIPGGWVIFALGDECVCPMIAFKRWRL